MDIIEFKGANGPIAIPVDKITGFCKTSPKSFGPCFIATGADGTDGEENGWYVQDTYEEVLRIMRMEGNTCG